MTSRTLHTHLVVLVVLQFVVPMAAMVTAINDSGKTRINQKTMSATTAALVVVRMLALVDVPAIAVGVVGAAVGVQMALMVKPVKVDMPVATETMALVLVVKLVAVLPLVDVPGIGSKPVVPIGASPIMQV
jgi:hypothetical protein